MQAVQHCTPSTHAGRLYRVVQLQYLATLTSTEGAWKGENRFTAPQVSQALYLAQAPDLAMLEATRQFQSYFDTPEFPAYAIFPVDVDLQCVIDLTRDDMQEAVGTSLEELTGDWRAARKRQLKQPQKRVVTHDLGAAVKEAGFEGLKYYSAYDSRRWNMVVFTENLTREFQVIFDLPEAAIEATEALSKKKSARKKQRT